MAEAKPRKDVTTLTVRALLGRSDLQALVDDLLDEDCPILKGIVLYETKDGYMLGALCGATYQDCFSLVGWAAPELHCQLEANQDDDDDDEDD